VTLRHCSENGFCARLSTSTRDALCARCAKATLAGGTHVSVNFHSDFLLIEGLCVLEMDRDIDMVIRPGDFAMPPSFDPNSPERASAMDYGEDVGPIARETHLMAIKDSTYASFDKKAVRELFDIPEFALAMYENLRSFSGHAMYYHVAVFGQPAYDAVRHVLKFAKTYQLGPLTHAQIALLTKRGRSTVTEAMHEIALAEPELLA
jgi:hypothetical protein